MSKAIEEMINEAEERGRVEAVIQLGILKQLTMEQIAADLAVICNITEKDATERMVRFQPSNTMLEMVIQKRDGEIQSNSSFREEL